MATLKTVEILASMTTLEIEAARARLVMMPGIEPGRDNAIRAIDRLSRPRHLQVSTQSISRGEKAGR